MSDENFSRSNFDEKLTFRLKNNIALENNSLLWINGSDTMTAEELPVSSLLYRQEVRNKCIKGRAL